MKYTLGLDIGITSVGWSVINNGKNRIEDIGVRIFDAAEQPKTGDSLASPRREARITRRRLRRRKARLSSTINLFISECILKKEEIENCFSDEFNANNNLYLLRHKALSNKITEQQFFRIVYLICKRRGFRSSRKSLEVKDVKNSEMLSATEENKKLVTEDNLTIGSALYRQKFELNSKDFESIRNKGGSYVHTLLRQNLYDELRLIIEKQKSFGMVLSEKFELELLGDRDNYKDMGLFGNQEPMQEGEALLKKVGDCTFEKGEKRAPKASYSFWYFNVLQRINNIKIQGGDRETLSLSKDERKKILDAVLSHKSLNYSQIRKIIGLKEIETFNMVRYDVSNKIARKQDKNTEEPKEKDPEKETDLIYIKGGTDGKSYALAYADIKKALLKGGDIEEEVISKSLNDKYAKLFNDIAYVLTIYKTDDSIKSHLSELLLSEASVEDLMDKSYAKFGHLSLKALQKFIPFLEEGKTYDDACSGAGYVFSGSKSKKSLKLLPLSRDEYSITSPVVKRAINQTIRVVNAITKKYGAPFELHIELAREMSKDHSERKKTEKEQEENRVRNEKIIEDIKLASQNAILEPHGKDIVKYKLWKEQHSKCMYSGSPISERELFSDNHTQIDHIIPYSRSQDDSYTNKVLVLTSANQDKRNQTPYEWLGGNEDVWRNFEGRVRATYGEKSNKAKKMLAKTVDPEGWKTRNLQDTRHATKFLRQYFDDYLLFSEGEKETKRRVVVVNGSATSYLRKRYGLAPKDRDENNLHHAVDAILVAVCGQDLIQKIAGYEKNRELSRSLLKASNALAGAIDPATGVPYTEEDKERAKMFIDKVDTMRHIPSPWPNFRKEVELRTVDSDALDSKLLKEINGAYHDEGFTKTIVPIFVSRKLKMKDTGEAHAAKYRSAKLFEKQASYIKTPIESLKPEDVELMYNKESDKILYEKLKARLALGKDAFKEPLYKNGEFDKNGKRIAPVKSVKIENPSQKSGFVIIRKDGSKALVGNGSMLYLEVYKRKNKKGEYQFFTVPIYVHQVRNGSKVILPEPKGDTPKEIDETFEFMFTVYPNTLLEITDKKESTLAYYVKYGVSNGAYSLIFHSKTSKEGGDLKAKNILNAIDVKKYYVDELGRKFEIKKEKRSLYKA